MDSYPSGRLSRCKFAVGGVGGDFAPDGLGHRHGRRLGDGRGECPPRHERSAGCGGGWINGRDDDTQVMFEGYGHMVDFLTSFEWWKTEPHDELVNDGAYCLAKPGEIYVV